MHEIRSKEQWSTTSPGPLTPKWMSNLFKWPASQRQGKAPASSAMSGTPSGSMEFINIQIPINESALTNLVLAKLLVEVMLLLTDKQS